MTKRTMQVVVIAIFAAILVVGVGVGMASGGLTGNQDTFLNDVAKRLNVTPDQLKAALKGAASDQIDAAVKAGKLTQAQGDALKQRLEQGQLPFFGVGPRLAPGLRHGFGFGFGFAGLRSVADAAASYLGLTQADLLTQLASGKSLAQIASDNGKTVDGLKTAITDASQSKLNAAVKAGDLTQTQADAIQKKLTDNLDAIVNATPPVGLRPGFDGGKGFGFRHGGFGPIGGGAAPQGSSRFTPIPA